MSENVYLVDKYNIKCVDDVLDDNIFATNCKNTDDLWLYSSDPYKCYLNKHIINNLRKISSDESMPHIIFYGNPGTGIGTIMRLFLEMVFDKSVNKMDDSKYIVMSSGNNENEIIIKQSDHHIIIEPNNTNFDRYLIQEIVKEYAKKMPLHIFDKNKGFKAVQINNLDNLSYYAQTSLRRTIEKYSKTCRFIMRCYSLSKVIEPLRSRCLCIHVPTQTNDNLLGWANNIAIIERIKIPPHLIINLIESSNGNLKNILWKLDLYKHCKRIKNSYEICLEKLINEILEISDKSVNNNPDKSVNNNPDKSKIVSTEDNILDMNENIINIPLIRDYIYKLYIKNISSNIIIKDIFKEILLKKKDISPEKTSLIIKCGCEFEYRLSKKRRDIIHIEAFIIGIINILSKNEDIIY